MTQKELGETIEKTKSEIKQLEEDLLVVKNEASKIVLKRALATSKHVLRQYLVMKELV